MTIWTKPWITPEKIASMEPYEAFRYAEDLMDSRYPREAVRVLQPLSESDPDNAAVWELLGRAHFASAHLTLAENAFRRLIELEPTSAWAHTALGLSLDRQSRHREGALFHRLASVMGRDDRDASRVELVESPLEG